VLYQEAFKAPASVLEILNTSRRSISGCWSVLGMRNVPCQMPTMSVGEAAVAAAVCPVAAACVPCAAAAGAGDCAPAHTPAAAISPATATPASRDRHPIDFRPTTLSHPACFVLMAKPFLRAFP